MIGSRSRSQWLFFLEKNFVITLPPLYIDWFWFYITQMFSMTISWTSSSLKVLGPRSRSQLLFFRKNVAIALAPSFMDRFCCNFTQIFSMKNILIKFKFQLSRAKGGFQSNFIGMLPRWPSTKIAKTLPLKNRKKIIRQFLLYPWADFIQTS